MKNDTRTILDDVARILANGLSILGIPGFLLTFWNSLSETRTWRVSLEPFFLTFLILYATFAVVTAAYYSNEEAKEEGKRLESASWAHKLARALLFR